ncbi:MAG: thioredoxin family protein [Bacteroidia bacterium]|nr:thioredoxin family protein [Bacteroidia bacterium]
MKYTSFSILLVLIVLSSFSPPSGYQPGDKAKDFKLRNVDGKMYSLSQDKEAKGFIVIFTCNHCPFSVAYEDRILALDKKYKTLGYPVIAVNPNDERIVPDDSFDNMVKRAKEKNFTFPYLQDATQYYAREYGAQRTPHVYVLQRDGKELIVKYIGAIDNNTYNPEEVTERYVENAVNELVEGKQVSVPFTKAIGCTIKWKKS